MSAPVVSGYAGFGSFHSDNVEEMIAAGDFQPPALPDEVARLHERLAGELQQWDEGSFGQTAAMERFFMLDGKTWTFLNHGAFGAPARPVYDAAELWRRFAEEQPLRFIDRLLFPHLVQTTRLLAEHVGAQPGDVALLPNVTSALNSILNSAVLHFCRVQSIQSTEQSEQSTNQSTEQSTLVIFSLDIGYGATKKIIRAAAELAPTSTACCWQEIVVALPGSDDEICATVERSIAAHRHRGGAALAVFDYVTSNTALVLPVARLIEVCRRHDTLVLIDGAHALGAFELQLERLDADFFAANCHKWFLCPRGSAFLWVRRRHQGWIRPPVVSHGAGAGFVSQFVWDGARDYSPLLAVGTALIVWRRHGAAVRRYQRQLVADACRLLVERWGTDCLAAQPSQRAVMTLVRLPDRAVAPLGSPPTSAHAKTVQDWLHRRHAIEVPVKLINGALYVRISAHIYNSIAQYQALADAVDGGIATAARL